MDVTIAALLKSSGQLIDQVVTITGIATSLSNDKFLLNDGTGQILVEVEDDLVRYSIINGQSITVMGKLDDSSNLFGFELDACMLTDQNGTIVIIDDCTGDDSSLGDDDSDDDCDDDFDDDSDDDSDDDNGDDGEDD